MLLFGAIGLAVWFPLRYMQKGQNHILSVILDIVLTGVVTVAIWIFFSRYLIRSFLADKVAYDMFWSTTIVFRVAAGLLLYSMTILTYYLFLSATRLAEKASGQSKLESLVKEAELKMLRSQINPHFLFNSLNSISSLTLTDPPKAHEMIIKLSDFMRYSLTSRDDHLVTLNNEMKSMRLYLEIEKVRFRERLVTEETIEPECLEALLPGLLLQPIYENAVKHGVYESIKTVSISTTAVKKDENLVITISNTIDTDSVVTPKGTGIGIKNVKARLDLFFSGKAELLIGRKEDMFTATIVIPFQKVLPKKTNI
jgi:two-component system, LytTR family, sensor kinase